MAEAYLNALSKGEFEAHSAGLEPTAVLPEVVKLMSEEGIDLSKKSTQSVFDLYKSGALFELVITVCDAEVDAACPVFPGVTERLMWPFPDPSTIYGTEAHRLAEIKIIRDAIKNKIREFIAR